MKILSFIKVCAVGTLLIATQAVAQGRCSSESIIGKWTVSPAIGTCSVRFKNNGRIKGRCNVDGQSSRVRGVYSLAENCYLSVNARISSGDRAKLSGFIFSTSGLSRPNLGILAGQSVRSNGAAVNMVREPSYMLTADAYQPGRNLNRIAKREFGKGFSVVEWNDIKEIYKSEGGDFLRSAGIVPTNEEGPNGGAITVNGSREWGRSGRYYFITWGPVPGSYLVHDSVSFDGVPLNVGSWYNKVRIFATQE